MGPRVGLQGTEGHLARSGPSHRLQSVAAGALAQGSRWRQLHDLWGPGQDKHMGPFKN